MNFVEKLVSLLRARIDEIDNYANGRDSIIKNNCHHRAIGVEDAIEIVTNFAKEYNNGWISIKEKSPIEKTNQITQDWYVYPVMVNIKGTIDIRYYAYGDGHWWHGFTKMDEYVTHWMDIQPCITDKK